MKCLFNEIRNAFHHKSSIKPPGGAYLILDLPEGGLIREGGLFTKLCDKDKLFSSFIPYFAESTYNFMLPIDIFDTVFIPNHNRINVQGCVAK